jgi:cbb3-type cytochrome oxidase maturation protein
MNILLITIPISLILGAAFLCGFVWSVGDGQLDDTETPAHRILEDE